MGYLHYGEHRSFAFEDHLLTHLRTVILGKLSLHECTAFTWNDSGTQRSIWLHPGALLHFEFESDTTPVINHAWIQQLVALANSPGGLRIIEEPKR